MNGFQGELAWKYFIPKLARRYGGYVRQENRQFMLTPKHELVQYVKKAVDSSLKITENDV